MESVGGHIEGGFSDGRLGRFLGRVLRVKVRLAGVSGLGQKHPTNFAAQFEKLDVEEPLRKLQATERALALYSFRSQTGPVAQTHRFA